MLSSRAAHLSLFVLALHGCAPGSEPTASGATPITDGDDDTPEDAGGPAPLTEDAGDGSASGDGESQPADGSDGEPTKDCGVLHATVRDFTPTHPDFESAAFTAQNLEQANMAVTGMVASTLAADGTPAFASVGARPQVTSADSFASWYHDTPGVNQTIETAITLTKQPNGVWVYDNSAFFPIDGQGFGNYAPFANGLHNFHFTTELHMRFAYQAGQRFTFRGDDDLWLFVGGKLALDLGGLHLPLEGTLDMDALAAELGIAPGDEVPMDIFHAERHTEQSNFHIETNIECLVVVM